MQEVASAVGAVERNLVSPENEAGRSISRVTDAGEISPGACGIAGMHADAVAMNAANWFAGTLFLRSAAHVAQDELICGK